MFKALTCLLLTLTTCVSGQAARPAAQETDAPPEYTQAAETSAATAKRLKWWSDARFGMFIHWGLYAQDGCFYKGQDGKTEHMMRHLKIPLADYTKIGDDFNPAKFNADEWVAIAKSTGMKYMIITSKHHDGFAMWDSAASGKYNIVKGTPFKRDVVKELADACGRGGIKFGVYYSLGRDWQDPDVPTSVKADGNLRSNDWDYPDEDKKDFTKYFERKVKPQIRELLTGYGPIAVMWFDTPERISKAQSKELLDLIHGLQPECIVNSRVGNSLGEYAVEELRVPETGETKPWETCMTLNRHWGYKKNDDEWKSSNELVHRLIDIASKGGNFLLNVGPTGEGLIPDPSVVRLKKVGQWMALNRVAIYGTTGSPFPKPFAWGRCTKKVNGDLTNLYLHVFDWPKDGKLLVPGLKNQVVSATLPYADSAAFETSSDENDVTIKLPANAPDAISSTVVLTVRALCNHDQASVEKEMSL